MPDSKLVEALRSTTAQEWFRAEGLWHELRALAGNPLVGFFTLQTALRVGDAETVKQLLPLQPACLRHFLAAQKVLDESEALLRFQERRPIDPELEGRPLGRFLIASRRFLPALKHWIDLSDPRFAAERDLRLAQLLYRLGEYHSAVRHIEACLDGRYAQRAESLMGRCDIGQQRVERLANRRPELLPHPLLRELRTACAESETIPLAVLAMLALALGVLVGDMSDFTLMLRRGMVAKDEALFAEMPDSMAADLAGFVASPQFRDMDSPALRDYLAKCCIRRGFFQLVDTLIGDGPAPVVAATAAPALASAAPEVQPAPAQAVATAPSNPPPASPSPPKVVAAVQPSKKPPAAPSRPVKPTSGKARRR